MACRRAPHKVQLQRLADGRWSYQSISTARGLFRLVMPAELHSRSLFTIRDDHIVPEQFTAEDGTRARARIRTYVRLECRSRHRHGRTTPRRPAAAPGLLDSLSVQVALMHELLGPHAQIFRAAR